MNWKVGEALVCERLKHLGMLDLVPFGLPCMRLVSRYFHDIGPSEAVGESHVRYYGGVEGLKAIVLPLCMRRGFSERVKLSSFWWVFILGFGSPYMDEWVFMGSG